MGGAWGDTKWSPSIFGNEFWVTVARGSHPFPSRTRQVTPSAPMVLRRQRRGRVGSCPNKKARRPARDRRAFAFWGGMAGGVGRGEAGMGGHGDGETRGRGEVGKARGRE